MLAFDRRSWLWARHLEEYETLFPGTADVRVKILRMLQDAGTAATNLAEQHGPGSPPLKTDVAKFGESIFDILSLSWDLLIYLQNESIGRITGNKIPARTPSDSCPIRLIADKRGVLKIVGHD